ncbi:MAG: DNA polymerase I [Candidatus Omnitrophica bacterium]|nr:DNA polymerase I [Candidatus Omnitrophota bacterium]
MSRRLYLIDATAFCYRAFYAIRELSTSFGQPTNAIYGFVNILNKILKEKKPEYLAACFDVSRDTFRTKKFAEYKIQRPPMPDGLSSQIGLIKEIISAYGICILEKQGFEADDVIATFAKSAAEAGLSTTIISSDKDILQLVDEDTEVFSPYKDEGVVYNRQKVFERFGVKPEGITDLIALAGDDADNIPGVPGIGEKTATELLGQFGTLENLLKNTGKIKQDKIRKSVESHLEQIKLSRELAVLDKGVRLDFDLDRLKVRQPDDKELFRLFKHLEFKKFLNNLTPQGDRPLQAELPELEDKELKKMVKAGDELVLCGSSLGDLVLASENKVFRVPHPAGNLKSILEDPKIKKVSYDLKKIKVSLAKEDVILGGLHFDVMIAAYLLDPSKSAYELGDIAWDYLGKTFSGDINNQGALELVRQLRPKLQKELAQKSLASLFTDLEMPLEEVLAQMEIYGIKLNTKALEGLSREIEKRLIKLIEDIYELSGCQFNINSPKQLRDILFERLKLPVVKRTKTGPSTDEEVLKNLSQKHKLPELLLEYRQLTKIKNTYADALPGLIDSKTGRIHTSFNQTGTETGRLSSSNPNLQNIPIKTDIGKKIRQAVISSSPESYLLSCDYSQVELRILAHLSGDQDLASAFKGDKDIHRATASLIYGLEEKDITEEMRDTAKRVNFGIIYGLTSYGLSRDLGITIDQAQGFIDAYFLRYKKVKEYIEEQIKIAQKEGFVTTLLGRRRYIPGINNKNLGIRQFAQRQAVNTPIQGSASDLIKLAMIHIYKDMQKMGLSAKMIMQIHDELVFDVPDAEVKKMTALAKEKMEHVMKLDVPVKVDIKIGRNWLDMEKA